MSLVDAGTIAVRSRNGSCGRVLVTGSNGFIGTALTEVLRSRGWNVLASTRRAGKPGVEGRIVAPSLDPLSDWRPVLGGVEFVVHLAGRVHVMRDHALNPLDEFRRVNVEGTLALARTAASLGVRRFVFVSSVKVNGETTLAGIPFRADDPPAPADPYGVSKREAEDALFELGQMTGMEIVVIRPPLVYGPGVKANFLAMMRWLARGLPLPLGAIRNRRTLVALDNLVDLIATCLEHDAAANQIFMAGDAEDLSTTDLLRKLGTAIGSPARLFPAPPWAVESFAAALGRRALAQRLCGNLQVDITKTRQLLGWTPPVSVDEGLRRAAASLVRTD